MVLAILGGVLLAAVAIAWEHVRALRRLRLARLLDDPRYAAAVDLLWERQETAEAFLDTLEMLVDRGIDRDVARRNLTRLVDLDSESAHLVLRRIRPTPPACDLHDPWERKPTPASSSAFIMPGTSFGGGDAGSTMAAGPHA